MALSLFGTSAVVPETVRLRPFTCETDLTTSREATQPLGGEAENCGLSKAWQEETALISTRGDRERLHEKERAMRKSDDIPPTVFPMEASQKVVFSERFDSQFNVWNSGSVTLLDQKWSFRFIREDSRVDFRIKFEGPSNTCDLQQIIIIIGTPGSLLSGDNSIVEVIKKVKFIRFEARLVKNLCDIKALEKVSELGKLRFSVKFISTGVNVKADKELEDKVNRLTRERNSMASLMHKQTIDDSVVSPLNHALATQPEVTRQYEAFKQASKEFVFEVLNNYSTEDYGEVMSEFVRRIKMRVQSQHKEQVQQVLTALNITSPGSQVVKTTEAAIRDILRAGEDVGLNQLSKEEMMQVREVMNTSAKLDFVAKKQSCFDFAKFIWSFELYVIKNMMMFVNWNSFGTFVNFERSKHTSISRRVRAGEECFIVLPTLQRKPFGEAVKQVQPEYEVLCRALVYPV